MLATECQVLRQSRLKLTSGCKALDEILGGGLETGSITEARALNYTNYVRTCIHAVVCYNLQISGEYRTGKTQLAHTLCVTSQLSMEQGGGAGKVILIDTEGTLYVTALSV
jgi:RecA/RadA recombinase